MYIFGDTFKEITDAMQAENNPDEISKALRVCNMKLRDIAKLDSWEEMRDVAEVEYSGDAVQLPSNLIGIDLVWDDTNEIEYFDRNRHSAEAPEYAFRYYTYPIGTNLAKVNDVAIQQDGTTFVSDDLFALGLDTDDEWFRVNGVDQYYQITSNADEIYTFAPAFRGIGNLSSASIIVRPHTTKMLQLVGPLDADVGTATIDLHYWAQPDILRDMDDVVPLPTSAILTLSALADLPEAQKLRPVSAKRVKEATSQALSLNPDKPGPRVPRGITGRRINFAANPYGARGARTGMSINSLEERWRRNGTTI